MERLTINPELANDQVACATWLLRLIENLEERVTLQNKQLQEVTEIAKDMSEAMAEHLKDVKAAMKRVANEPSNPV